MGSGKSTLAGLLAQSIGCARIELDHYIVPECAAKRYVDKLRVGEFKRDLGLRVAESPIVIVDGICLRDVMDEVGAEIGTSVYVKRVSQQGIWHDGCHLESYELEPTISESVLSNDEFRYHLCRKPHETADIVLLRTEHDHF